MQYTVAFTFTTTNSTDTLKAQLMLYGGNVISLSSNQQVQIQSPEPSWAAALNSLIVAHPSNERQPSIALEAVKNKGGAQQSVAVIVPIQQGGSNLTGNYPFSGVDVNLQYQFIGYSSRGSISVGDFSIPFPLS
ncbi:hypothetical protein AAHK20_01335 [Trinickia sp. YCB016]